MSGPIGRFAAGLAIKTVLKRLGGRDEPTATAEFRRGEAARRRRSARQREAASRAGGPVAHAQARRGLAFFVMMGSIALALPLMLIFEHPVTRVFGVVFCFTFILAGVFAIADPSFLEADDQEPT